MARQHARHLIARGHAVSYMHPRVGEGVPGAENLDIPLHTDVVPVHEYLPSAGDSQKAVSTMSAEQAFAYLPAYAQALDPVAAQADVVVGHHANLSAVAVHDVARKHGKPYVLFLHGTGIEPRHHGGYDDAVWARIEEAIEGAAGVLVTTDYVRDALVRPLVNLPLEQFLVLPCGVDLKRFGPENTAEVSDTYDLPETFVICPGALTRAKGPQNVVEASRAYADLAPTLFIGDGELRGELEAALGERGRFLGFVPTEDKERLINAAALLTAAPEKKEHFGIIYVEALAAGTVPVAYGGGGVPSILSEDVGVMTERDSASLGAAVRSLLLDPERRKRMARAGRARAEARYGYPQLVDQLESWLTKVVSG